MLHYASLCLTVSLVSFVQVMLGMYRHKKTNRGHELRQILQSLQNLIVRQLQIHVILLLLRECRL